MINALFPNGNGGHPWQIPRGVLHRHGRIIQHFSEVDSVQPTKFVVLAVIVPPGISSKSQPVVYITVVLPHVVLALCSAFIDFADTAAAYASDI